MSHGELYHGRSQLVPWLGEMCSTESPNPRQLLAERSNTWENSFAGSFVPMFRDTLGTGNATACPESPSQRFGKNNAWHARGLDCDCGKCRQGSIEGTYCMVSGRRCRSLLGEIMVDLLAGS